MSYSNPLWPCSNAYILNTALLTAIVGKIDAQFFLYSGTFLSITIASAKAEKKNIRLLTIAAVLALEKNDEINIK